MPIKRDEQGNLILVIGASDEDSDWIKSVPGADERRQEKLEKQEREKKDGGADRSAGK